MGIKALLNRPSYCRLLSQSNYFARFSVLPTCYLDQKKLQTVIIQNLKSLSFLLELSTSVFKCQFQEKLMKSKQNCHKKEPRRRKWYHKLIPQLSQNRRTPSTTYIQLRTSLDVITKATTQSKSCFENLHDLLGLRFETAFKLLA